MESQLKILKNKVQIFNFRLNTRQVWQLNKTMPNIEIQFFFDKENAIIINHSPIYIFQIAMYNYYTNKKQKTMHTQQQQEKEIQQRLYKLRTQNCKKLVRKFVDRAVHGYDRMVDLNKQVKQYRDHCHQFRDQDKSKNIGPPSFYFKPRNQKQRITDIQRQNRQLDEIPFCSRINPSTHKFRQLKPTLNFKFTSFDSASRVLQSVQTMKTNEVPTSWDMDIRGYIKKRQQSQNTSPASSKVKALKHLKSYDQNVKNLILPSLNIRHHPKSFESIQNNIGVGVFKDPLLENLAKGEEGICLTDRKENLDKKDKDINTHGKSFTVHTKVIGSETILKNV